MKQFEYMRNKQNEIDRLRSELEWYRAYGSYINTYHNKADAEASEYADQEQNNES
mgnify:CR=1 FL=1